MGIKNIKRLIFACFAIFVIILLSACATTAKYRQQLEVWKGKPISQFEKFWGYPNKIITLQNGNKAYIYSQNMIQSTPITQMPSNITSVTNSKGDTSVISTPGVIVGGQTYSLQCTTWVVINKKGTIVDTYFRGNDCVAY